MKSGLPWKLYLLLNLNPVFSNSSSSSQPYKGAQSVSAYFQKAQGFANLLAAIGKPIDNSELISHILAGLGVNYDPLVTSVTTRQDSIPLTNLYGYMFSYEQRLEAHKSALE
jgi:hypothetical protein